TQQAPRGSVAVSYPQIYSSQAHCPHAPLSANTGIAVSGPEGTSAPHPIVRMRRNADNAMNLCLRLLIVSSCLEKDYSRARTCTGSRAASIAALNWANGYAPRMVTPVTESLTAVRPMTNAGVPDNPAAVAAARSWRTASMNRPELTHWVNLSRSRPNACAMAPNVVSAILP